MAGPSRQAEGKHVEHELGADVALEPLAGDVEPVERGANAASIGPSYRGREIVQEVGLTDEPRLTRVDRGQIPEHVTPHADQRERGSPALGRRDPDRAS